MKNNTLIDIYLKYSSKKDIKNFQRLVNAEYLNKPSNASSLIDNYYKYLVRHSKHPDILHIKKKVFGESNKSSQQFYDTCHQLLKLFKKFAIHSELESSPIHSQLNLLQYLRKKGMSDDFIKELDKINKSVDKSDLKDQEYHFNKYQIADNYNQFYLDQRTKRIDLSLQEKSDFLDSFYFSSKLKDCCEMISRENIQKVVFRKPHLDRILEIVETDESLLNTPSIQVYYLIIQLFLKNMDKLYESAFQYTLENRHLFPNEEQINILSYLYNYCIAQINQGNEDYLRKAHEADILFLDSKLLFNKNQFSQWKFKNICTIALRLKEYKWTESFINQFSQYLPINEQETAIAYNNAALNYELGNYKSALKTLNITEFKEITYILGAKSIQLKIYHEQNDTEALSYLVNSFSSFMKRNKQLSDNQKLTYLNFIQLTDKINQLKNSKNSKNKATTLKAEIIQTSPVANNTWLISQVNELI